MKLSKLWLIWPNKSKNEKLKYEEMACQYCQNNLKYIRSKNLPINSYYSSYIFTERSFKNWEIEKILQRFDNFLSFHFKIDVDIFLRTSHRTLRKQRALLADFLLKCGRICGLLQHLTVYEYYLRVLQKMLHYSLNGHS